MQLVLLQLKAVQTDAASKIEIQLKLFPRCTSLGQIASKEKTTGFAAAQVRSDQ